LPDHTSRKITRQITKTKVMESWPTKTINELMATNIRKAGASPWGTFKIRDAWDIKPKKTAHGQVASTMKIDTLMMFAARLGLEPPGNPVTKYEVIKIPRILERIRIGEGLKPGGVALYKTKLNEDAKLVKRVSRWMASQSKKALLKDDLVRIIHTKFFKPSKAK